MGILELVLANLMGEQEHCPLYRQAWGINLCPLDISQQQDRKPPWSTQEKVLIGYPGFCARSPRGPFLTPMTLLFCALPSLTVMNPARLHLELTEHLSNLLLLSLLWPFQIINLCGFSFPLLQCSMDCVWGSWEVLQAFLLSFYVTIFVTLWLFLLYCAEAYKCFVKHCCYHGDLFIVCFSVMHPACGKQ